MDHFMCSVRYKGGSVQEARAVVGQPTHMNQFLPRLYTTYRQSFLQRGLFLHLVQIYGSLYQFFINCHLVSKGATDWQRLGVVQDSHVVKMLRLVRYS